MISGNDTISFYKRKNKFNVMDRSSEHEVAVMAAGGDKCAIDRLILSNIKYVERVAYKYSRYCNEHTGISLDDLIQAGTEGIIVAAKKFDPNHGTKFITYATFWIQAKINDFVRRNFNLVGQINTSSGKNLFFKQSLIKGLFGIRDQMERETARIELANRLKVSVKDIKDMEGRIAFKEVSTNTPVYDDSTIEDSIGADSTIEEDVHSKKLKSVVQDAIDKAELSNRDRDILMRRFFDKTTHEELAVIHKLTRQRCHQIEKLSLLKVGDALRNMGFSKQDLI